MPSTEVGISPAGGRWVKPKRDTTPSTSISRSGRAVQLLIAADDSLTAGKVLKDRALGTDERERPARGSA